MVKPLSVYKASAGSGKTFTLATEYISLLVENPMSYRSILAVTFTNKATEEMKMRILSQLYGIWQQLPDSDDYMKAVREKTGLDTNTISSRARISLSNLLNNYNQFRVETIDTFFQSMMRNLARELELTTNLRIGLNDYQVEELAVDQLIADLKTTDTMLQWILRYIMDNISDDKPWNVIGQIKQFGRMIFSDAYKDVSSTLEQTLKEPGFFDTYTTRLRCLRQSAEDRMKQFADTFFDILDNEGLTIDDFPYGKTGLCSFFLKLRQGIFDEGIVGQRVTDCLGNPAKWYTKNHPRRELIHDLADNTFNNLLRQALDERPRQWRIYKSADLTLRHLSQLRLLGSIQQKVRELNQDANRFLLSDTQQLLHSLIGDSDSPFIFEKIGTQLDHVMIDEFQDTSTVQWHNFRVLLNETMSHESSSRPDSLLAVSKNLIVGDVKQSIYRWRAGDWRLLNNIEAEYDPRLTEACSLDTNYRSQRRIITFNNTFFRQAAQLEYLSLRETNEAEASQLEKAYADVVQQIPSRRGNEGFVHVELLPAENYQAQVFQRLTETVGELLAVGATQRQIAILVRTNAIIPRIAQYFIEQMPSVTIVSDEAFRLDASVAVNLIIRAMRLLVHPDDLLTKAAIAKSYHSDILHDYQGDAVHLLNMSSCHDTPCSLDFLLPEAFIAHFDQLRAMPLYDLAERLYNIFGLENLPDQSSYVCAFYDYLVNFVNENTADITAFLNEWDETLCSKTIQCDETSGVRIFSIHKSKGLEYEHVICPFCDWPLEKSGNVLWCQPTEKPFNDLPIIPVDYSQKQMMGTIYEADYRNEHLQNTVDNLNLLYVAFTRACRSLFVIGRRQATGTRSLIIEQALPLVAKHLRNNAPTETILLEGLEDDRQSLSFTYGILNQGEKRTSHFSSNPFLQPYEPLPVAIHSFESKVDFRQSNRSKAFLDSNDKETTRRQNYIQTGSILHEIFSTIHTADDIPDALQRLQSEGVIYDSTITQEQITEMLRKRLNDPRVADWFSSRWTLFNECVILSVENNQVFQHRPDRVMTDGHKWIVVDFKFGSTKPEHHDQVRQYMNLIQRMSPTSRPSLFTSIRGYLWYVYANQIEEVTLSSNHL